MTVTKHYRVTAKLNGGNNNIIENVFDYAVTFDSEPLTDDVLADAAVVMEDLYNEVKSHLATAVQFISIIVHDVIANEPVGEIPWPTLTFGLASGNWLPPGDAACITLPTGHLKTRGRKFFGPLLVADVTNGYLLTGVVTALNAFAALLLAPSVLTDGSVWQYVVYAKKITTVFTPTAALIGAAVAYQRRRKPEVGI